MLNLSDKNNLDDYLDEDVRVSYIDNFGKEEVILGKLKDWKEGYIVVEYIKKVGSSYQTSRMNLPFDAASVSGKSPSKAAITDIKNKFGDLVYKKT